MNKVLINIVIIVILFAGINFGADQVTTAHLDKLVEEALENNPDLKASYNAWQAAKTRIPQAASLPDPVLGVSAMNLPVNSFDFNQEPMTGKQVFLMQMFPFPGKLGVKKNIAKDEAKIFGYQYQEMRNQLIKTVTLIYNELSYVDRAIETSEKNAALLKQFTQIAETRYRVGKGLQQDVLKSQVELSKISDKLVRLRQQQQSLWIQLTALLNQPSNSSLGQVSVILYPGSIKKIDSALLDSLAELNRPLVLAWKGMVNQSQHKVSLAKKSYLPDFNLGVTYTQRDELPTGMGGVDYLSGSITMSLPIYFWSKQKKQVEESKFNQISVAQRYVSIRRQVQSEIENKLSELNKNIELLLLYQNGILTQASQSVQSALAAYQVDKVDFLTLVNNQITLFNYELDYYRVLSDYYKNIAELEALVGTKL